MTEINQETLKMLKQAGYTKPEGVSEGEWLAAGESDVFEVAHPYVPATISTPTHVPVVAQPTPTSFSLDDLMFNGMAVDFMLKTKNGSFGIGDAKIRDNIKVKVLFNELAVKQTIKVQNRDGGAEYFHTYDGVNEVKGGLFQDKVAYCKSIDPKAFEFKSVDVVMELAEDVNGVKAGTRLGYSTSATANKLFMDFVKDCRAKGIDTKTGVALAEVSVKDMKKDSREWCVPVFKLIEG